MKRMFLMVVAMLSMTTMFAEGENMNSVESANVYDMSVSYAKLAKALRLSSDQLDAVEDVHEAFIADMKSVAAASDDSRKAMLKNAINKDLRNMHSVLDHDQYRSYVRLLNLTLTNRGLNK